MEAALKHFESLSDAEKIKFFQVLASSNSPEKSNSNILLGNLFSYPKELHADGNSPLDDSKKRQKTLDSWLIKSNISPKKNKENDEKVVSANCTYETSNTLESAAIPEEGIFNVYSVVNSNEFGIPPKQVHNNDSKIKGGQEKINVYCDEDKGLHVFNACESNTLLGDTSSYNLRSKRKFSEDICLENTSNNLNSQLRTTENYPIKDVSVNNLSENVNHETNLIIPNCVSLLGNVNHSPYNVESVPSVSCENQELKRPDAGYSSTCECSVENENYESNARKSSPKLQSFNEMDKHSVSVVDARDQSMHVESENNDLSSKKSSIFISPYEYEQFHKVKELCSKLELDICEIVQHEEVQNLLNDCNKYGNDTMIFIGAHESVTGKIFPVIHAHASENILLKDLENMQNGEF